MSTAAALPFPPRASHPTALQRFSLASGLIVALVGGAVLIGWVYGIATLKSLLPGLASMKPNTATCFILGGASLYLATAHPTRWRLVTVTFALLPVLIALLTLSEYAFGWDLSIDQLFFRDTAVRAGDPSPPGRMAPNTAAAFVLLGSALALLDAETRGGQRPAQWLAVLAAWIGFLSLLGYAFSVRSLYGITSWVNSYIIKPVDFQQFSETVRTLGLYWLLINQPPVL